MIIAFHYLLVFIAKSSLVSGDLSFLLMIAYKVEVLWSKGVKKLPPLSPLLVKGRNLYKLRTFRQVGGHMIRQEVSLVLIF